MSRSLRRLLAALVLASLATASARGQQADDQTLGRLRETPVLQMMAPAMMHKSGSIRKLRQVLVVMKSVGRTPDVLPPYDFKSKGQKIALGSTVQLNFNEHLDLEIYRMVKPIKVDPQDYWWPWDNYYQRMPPASDRRLHAVIRISRPIEFWTKPQVRWAYRRGGVPPASATGKEKDAWLRTGVHDLRERELVIEDDDYACTLRMDSPLEMLTRIRTIPHAELEIDRGRYHLFPDPRAPLRWYYVPERISLAERSIRGVRWPELSLLRFQRRHEIDQEKLIEKASLTFAVRIHDDPAVGAALRQALLDADKTRALTRLQSGSASAQQLRELIAQGRRLDDAKALRMFPNTLLESPREPLKYPLNEANAGCFILRDYWQAGIIPQLEVLPLPVEWAEVQLQLNLPQSGSLVQLPDPTRHAEKSTPRLADGTRPGVEAEKALFREDRLTADEARFLATQLRSAGVECRVRYVAARQLDMRMSSPHTFKGPINGKTGHPLGMLMYDLDPVSIVDDWLQSLRNRRAISAEERALLTTLRSERALAIQRGYRATRSDDLQWSRLARPRRLAFFNEDQERDWKLVQLAARYLLWIHAAPRPWLDQRGLSKDARADFDKILGSPFIRARRRVLLHQRAADAATTLGFLTFYQFPEEMPASQQEAFLVGVRRGNFHFNTYMKRLIALEQKRIQQGAGYRALPTAGGYGGRRPRLGVQKNRPFANNDEMIRALYAFEGGRNTTSSSYFDRWLLRQRGKLSLAAYSDRIVKRLMMDPPKRFQPPGLVLPDLAEEAAEGLEFESLEIEPAIVLDRRGQARENIAGRLLAAFKNGPPASADASDYPTAIDESDDAHLRITYPVVAWSRRRGWRQQTPDGTWAPMPAAAIRFGLQGLEGFADQVLVDNFVRARFSLKYRLRHESDKFTTTSKESDQTGLPLEARHEFGMFQGISLAPTPHESIHTVRIDTTAVSWNQLSPKKSELAEIHVTLQQGNRVLKRVLKPTADAAGVVHAPPPLTWLIRDVRKAGKVAPTVIFVMKDGTKKPWYFNAELLARTQQDLDEDDRTDFHSEFDFGDGDLDVLLTDADWR